MCAAFERSDEPQKEQEMYNVKVHFLLKAESAFIAEEKINAFIMRALWDLQNTPEGKDFSSESVVLISSSLDKVED